MTKLTQAELEEMKENLTRALGNDQITLIELHASFISVIKQKHGVEDLYFYHSQGSRAYNPQWKCSSDVSHMHLGQRTSAADTAKFLEQLSAKSKMTKGSFKRTRNNINVYFVDTHKTYYTLDDLKEDYLAMKLSGLLKKK